jgi:hypothetical protein
MSFSCCILTNSPGLTREVVFESNSWIVSRNRFWASSPSSTAASYSCHFDRFLGTGERRESPRAYKWKTPSKFHNPWWHSYIQDVP